MERGFRVSYDNGQMTVSSVAFSPLQWPPYAVAVSTEQERFNEMWTALTVGVKFAVRVWIVASEQSTVLVAKDNTFIVADHWRRGCVSEILLVPFR